MVRDVTPNWDAMHALFKAFDEDGDDNLDKQQVLDLLRVWGTPIDLHTLSKEWPNFDSNWDGAITWDECKRIYKDLAAKGLIH